MGLPIFGASPRAERSAGHCQLNGTENDFGPCVNQNAREGSKTLDFLARCGREARQMVSQTSALARSAGVLIQGVDVDVLPQILQRTLRLGAGRVLVRANGRPG